MLSLNSAEYFILLLDMTSFVIFFSVLGQSPNQKLVKDLTTEYDTITPPPDGVVIKMLVRINKVQTVVSVLL